MLGGERDLAAVRARLTPWLAARLGGPALEVSPLTKPGAGFSNETLLFEAAGARLVVRLQPTDFLVFPEYDLGAQCRIMQCLAPTDVPVPRVRWLEEDASVLGSPFYVMEAIEGEIPSEVPPYHASGFVFEATPARRASIWWSGITMLARIHRLDWDAHGLAFLGVPPGGTGPLDRQLAYYRRYLPWACPDPAQPVLAAALDWLEEHRYVPGRVTLCWGDARLGNLVYRNDRVVGVLDWEMAFLGDPEEDLGWWLFLDWANGEGYGMPRLAGMPGREETIRRYEALTGWRAEHVHYHEVFAALRFGIIMARVALRMKELGLPTPVPDFETNNSCTRWLAARLGLPPPGRS